MAKDIQMTKGKNTITITAENLEHFQKLGYKEAKKNVANKAEKSDKSEIKDKE
jgi:hypothetical protein